MKKIQIDQAQVQVQRDALNHVADSIYALIDGAELPDGYNDDGPRMRAFHKALGDIQSQLENQAKELRG